MSKNSLKKLYLNAELTKHSLLVVVGADVHFVSESVSLEHVLGEHDVSTATGAHVKVKTLRARNQPEVRVHVGRERCQVRVRVLWKRENGR